jgi:nucleoside-diphosphate-sugar epimerase
MNLARVATKRLRRYHGVQAMVADFYDALRNGRPPAAEPRTAARIAYWLEQVASDGDRRQQAAHSRGTQELTADTLVTGASGFIGGHLVRRLLADGRRLRLLCRRLPDGDLANHPQVEIVLGDLGHPETVDRAVAGVEVVYHVGATVHGTPAEFWRGSVAGTRNIVESCLKHEVKQLIYVSSLSVLQAIGQGGHAGDESAPLERFPERRGLYTQTKLAAEQLVVAAARERALPVAIVRPGEVIGEGAPRLSSGIGQHRGNRLIIFGDGKLNVPMVHVFDLIDAMQLCERLEVRDGSIFHLVDPHPATQNELAAQYGRLAGEQLRILHLPRLLVYVLGLTVQSACLLLRRSAPVSLYRLRSALAPRQFDASHAHQRLGWRPQRGVLQGLSEAINEDVADFDRARVAEVERVS